MLIETKIDSKREKKERDSNRERGKVEVGVKYYRKSQRNQINLKEEGVSEKYKLDKIETFMGFFEDLSSRLCKK